MPGSATCTHTRPAFGLAAQNMHVPGVMWNTEGPQRGCYFWGPGPRLLVMAVGKATMLVIVAKASGEHGGIACRLPCSF